MATMYKPQIKHTPQGGIRYVLATQEQIEKVNKILIPMDIYLSWEDNQLIFVPKEGYELPTRVEIKS